MFVCCRQRYSLNYLNKNAKMLPIYTVVAVIITSVLLCKHIKAK